MLNLIIRDKIQFVSNVRLVLRGYFSGYDDCTYIASLDRLANELDAEAVQHQEEIREQLCTFDFSKWTEFQTPILTDSSSSPYWGLVISFTNGLSPLCFCDEVRRPENFDDFLELMGVSWEDELYYNPDLYGDRSEWIGDNT